MIEIKMPRLSDTMEEGAISTWRKQPGDTVAVGDVLVEIETDKAVMEYEAYQAGTLAEILVAGGQQRRHRRPDRPARRRCRRSRGNRPGRLRRKPLSAERSQPALVGPVTRPPRRRPRPAPLPPQPGASANGHANGGGRQIASPLVRKLVRENHLDLSHVTGSGPGGRIIRADIAGLLARRARAGAAPAAGPPRPRPADRGRPGRARPRPRRRAGPRPARRTGGARRRTTCAGRTRLRSARCGG